MFQNQTLRKKIELGSYLNHPANIVSSIQDEKSYEIRSGIQRQSIPELSLYSLSTKLEMEKTNLSFVSNSKIDIISGISDYRELILTIHLR